MKPLKTFAFALILCAPTICQAGPKKKAYELFNKTKSEYWDGNETLRLTRESVREDRFMESSLRKGSELLDAFGERKPSSRLSVLHWKNPKDLKSDKKSHTDKVVLLIHGAMVDATMSFADNCYHTAGRTGLATHLVRAGYQVFALTFSHPHGDNDFQAEHIACALARIKEKTRAKKVDLIAHSKGTLAARLYASNIRAKLTKFTKYRKDIGTLILIGGPQGGLDINFAYPNLNYLIIAQKFDSPVIFSRAMVHGVWTDFSEQSFTHPKSAFLGQSQMLSRFDHIYGLITLEGQWDIASTYNGGQGAVSISPGIDKAIAHGGKLIQRLEKAGVAKDIKVAMLAGRHFHIIGYLGERRGPSDGVVLVRSALRKSAVTAKGAKVIRASSLALEHLELTHDQRAVDWILETLEP